MFGILLAFLTAVFTSLKDAMTNSAVKNINEYLIAWSMAIFVWPIALVVLLFYGLPETNILYWIALFVKVPLISLSFIFLAKAHKESDMSLIIPLLSFTPVFMLPFSFLIDQAVNLQGIIGIVLIVSGSYLLAFKRKTKDLLRPIKEILSDKGAKFMLVVSLIYAITSILDAVGVLNSGGDFHAAIFWVFCVDLFASFLLLPKVLKVWQIEKLSIRKNLKQLVPIGVFKGTAEIFQMLAMGLTLAVYVNSIKRTCIIISVLIGHFVFKEKVSIERYTGVLTMIVGVVFIIISQ